MVTAVAREAFTHKGNNSSALPKDPCQETIVWPGPELWLTKVMAEKTPDAVLILLAASGLTGRAQGTNAPGRPDYQAFKILTERNIFDPNRSPRSSHRRTSDSR